MRPFLHQGFEIFNFSLKLLTKKNKESHLKWYILLFLAAQCQPGTFSPSGLNETSSPCQPCPKGTYSGLDGATECNACPGGTNTVGIGAENVSMCVCK